MAKSVIDIVNEIADFATGAALSKGVFDEYIKAGFTEEQALYLTGVLISASGKKTSDG